MSTSFPAFFCPATTRRRVRARLHWEIAFANFFFATISVLSSIRIFPTFGNAKKKTPRGELDSADEIASDVCPILHARKLNLSYRLIRSRNCFLERIADCVYMKRASTKCIHVSILLFRASVKNHDVVHLLGFLKS